LSALPDLAEAFGVESLMGTLLFLAEEVQDRYAVPLRVVVVDTLLAAFAISASLSGLPCSLFNVVPDRLLKLQNSLGPQMRFPVSQGGFSRRALRHVPADGKKFCWSLGQAILCKMSCDWRHSNLVQP
jgi:hypothetical protein